MTVATEYVLTLPDGSTRTVAAGTTYTDLAHSISPRLAKASHVAKIDGETPVDLSREVDHDGPVEFCTWDSPEGQEVFRHSSAHLMALAIHELWPESKFGVGPAIDNGFYYDIDRPGGFTEADLEQLEKARARVVAPEEHRIPPPRSASCRSYSPPRWT